MYMYIYTHIYKIEFYLAIRKNDTMWFEGKWTEATIFPSYMWEIDTKQYKQYYEKQFTIKGGH
jgi:hypothetical protein